MALVFFFIRGGPMLVACGVSRQAATGLIGTPVVVRLRARR